MHTFSEKALTALYEAGWSEERQIDPTPYIEMLEKEGNVAFPAVVDFLRRFGGLELSWQHPTVSKSRTRLYILAPYMPGLVRIMPKFSLEGDEAVLAEKLCSIEIKWWHRHLND